MAEILLPGKHRVVVTGGTGAVEDDGAGALKVTLASRIAGEDIAADELKVRQMPTDVKVYTLAQIFGTTSVPAGSSRFGSWVNIEGYSRVTAYLKVTMATANFRLRMRMSPSATSPGGSDIQVDMMDVTVPLTGTIQRALSNMSEDAVDGAAGAIGRWMSLTVTDAGAGGGGTIDDVIVVCLP